MIRRVLPACLALLLAACSHLPTQAPRSETEESIVLMIGLDGLRYDAIDRWDAPNLQALAARGVRPTRMHPVMPSKTFVNFYSLATGLYPEHHGMVSNSPWDAEAERMFSTREGSPQDPFWWQGEPIWITAERQDVRSHIMFWLGSEAPFDGDYASVWHPYQHDMPYEDRVAEVLSWFDAPAEEQPRFAAVYFDHVDTVIHRSGPFMPGEGEAVARVDALVGQMIAGLEERGLLERTNIIVVSDHGMAPVGTERVILIDNYSELDGLFVEEFAGQYGAGLEPFLMAYGDAEAVDRAYAELQDAHPHLSVYRPDEYPDHWHFDHATRGPDLFILADPEWLISRSDANLSSPYLSSLHGQHGFDNRAEQMGATFIGAGPVFPQGTRPEAFENVNVYGIIACALGLDPAETDGDPAEVERITGGNCPAE
ncbi:nucleotide pyrophosphatase/phosphodiesterase family protein [Maricaulis parjimensis]|uniref:nucleotide pyrophosphatase/phosphodiesterase family protein n=1 Tax=Maricaulis parjimensis TaxID=144023 RepID=UPI00193A0A5B|nr:nucleotide pyrophosphatase/phosphodiesterase family protein [Maricaulis parjimensis]